MSSNSTQLQKNERRGFTLTELLVVIAITAVLMLVLMVPLSRSLELTSRGRAQVEGQDKVRGAMRQVVRDLSNAMEVFEPRAVQLWGYSAWTNRRNRPEPAAGAVPEALTAQNALIAFRLPVQRYYCLEPGLEHFITADDMNQVAPGADYDMVALDACPRNHPNGKVELRPVQPLRPSRRITAYFVGLKDNGPNGRNAGGQPMYDNLLLFRSPMRPNRNDLNTYVLYRVEFDPTLPQYNLQTRFLKTAPDAGYTDFWYDTTSVQGTLPDGSQITQPAYAWWRDQRTALIEQLMEGEAGDVVRWVQTAGKYVPHSLCRFGPAASENEVAQPNRSAGTYTLGLAGPPLEYETDHGNWIGTVQGDGRTTVWDALVFSNTPAGAVRLGPRIQVVNSGDGTVLFDSSNGTRNRLVTFDSRSGKVSFAIHRWDRNAASPLLQEYYSATPRQDPLNGEIYVDLNDGASGDNVTDANGMPAGFGAAKVVAALAPTTRIVPGSEVVQIAYTGVNPPLTMAFEREESAGSGRDDSAAISLAPQQYGIDYQTGRIRLSGTPPPELSLPPYNITDWSQIAPNQPVQLLVKYQFQTNTTSDVVRVSYVTRELLAASIGTVQYTRKKSEMLPFEMTERIVVGNLRK